MKSWIITLPLLFATGLALAQATDRPAAAAAGKNEPAVVPAEILSPAEPAASDAAPAPKAIKPIKKAGSKARTRAKSLPKGDVRHCLDQKTRAEIIRCSETARGK